MGVLAAALVGLLGIVSLAMSGFALSLALSGRRAFEAALADDGADGFRARGEVLIDRIRHPALRWIINRRTGALAGTVLIGVVRDRLDTLRRSSLIGAVVGLGLIVFAFWVPGLLG